MLKGWPLFFVRWCFLVCYSQFVYLMLCRFLPCGHLARTGALTVYLLVVVSFFVSTLFRARRLSKRVAHSAEE